MQGGQNKPTTAVYSLFSFTKGAKVVLLLSRDTGLSVGYFDSFKKFR